MEGYPALAEVMSMNDGLDVFRRFSSLNIQNLLYMQAELNNLELDLKDIAAEDQCANPAELGNEGRRRYMTSARTIRESLEKGDGLQWKRVLQIRKLLKEYSKSTHYSLSLARYRSGYSMGELNVHKRLRHT